MEMIMVVIVFSLFLFGAFMVFSYGLKNYRLIDVKNETQNQAVVSVGRIMNDLILTDISTLVYGTAVEEYMSFETAINISDNEFKKLSGAPNWQGHILYYTYPRDLSATEKDLMRKYVPLSSPDTMPAQLVSTFSYLTSTAGTGQKINTVAKGIYDLDISVDSEKSIVNIILVVKKRFSVKKLAYDKDFSENVGNDTVTIKASIMPRNTMF
jgi:hypothetical protein